MARNKSEEVLQYKNRVKYLEREVTKLSKDSLSMVELVEEARSAASHWRHMWATVMFTDHLGSSRFLTANPLPWEELENEPQGAIGAPGPAHGAIGATGATGGAWPRGHDRGPGPGPDNE